MAVSIALTDEGLRTPLLDDGGSWFFAYGMDPNATAADNGTALRAAISRAAAENGVVRLPSGTYDIDGFGDITDMMSIVGPGKGSCTLNYTGSGNALTVSGQGDGRTILKGFSLANTGSGVYGMLISRRVFVEDVTVDNFTDDNIHLQTGADPNLEAPYLSHFVGVHSQNSDANGIYVGPTCNVVTFVGCDVKNNDRGYHIVQAENYTILSGQTAYHVQEGIRVENSAFGTILGLYGEGNDSGGGTADALFDATCSNTTAHFGNLQGTITVNSSDGMNVTRGGARIGALPMNLRDIDFGSDGTSSFTVGPSNGTSGFANVLKHSNTGGGSANAYEWDVAGVGTVWRIGAQNISYVPLHSENSTSTTATPNLDLNDQQIVARSESFTDLGTTPQSLHGGVRLGVGFRMDCTLQTPAAHHATFTIYGGFQSGVAFLFSGVQGANCTLTETTDGNFEVTNVGDGRTYTLNVDTGSGTATLKADATVSGTTTLHYFLLAQRK